MKRILLLIFPILFFSCNDGNFDIPAFEFTDTLNNCGEYLLYKSNSSNTEAIILTLSPSELTTTEGETTTPISTTQSVIYRIFSSGITSSYFCNDIPPVNPTVEKELNAESGTIHITTTAVKTDNVITGYNYYITISNLLFKDGSDRIFFENFEFGTYSITL